MQFRETRQLFFNRLNSINSVEELLAFQIDVAEAILDTERKLETRKYDRKELQSHIKCLRLYADALVWWNLHPHSIRQLAKGQGTPQSLLSQGNAFANVVMHARRYCQETRLPILIADITNVIKIGDLIVVVDPEHPQIVECKTKLPSPRHLMRGRIGRQLSRAIGTMRYLKEGAGKIFGEKYYEITVESQHRAERNWEVVDRLCSQALRLGEAYLEISQGDHLWALRSGRERDITCTVNEKAKSLGMAQFGTSLGLMNFRDGLYPPPSAWRPVSPEVRFELIEGTIVWFHLVSYDALAGDYGDGQRITIQDVDYPIIVSLHGKEYPLSRRFIYDIVYGFETVESCARGLLIFAHDLASSVPPDLPDVPDGKPRMWYVETVEEISLLLKQDDLSHFDYVGMPRQLADSLAGVRQTRQGRTQGLAVMKIDVLQRLAGKYGLTRPTLEDPGI